MTHHHTTRRSLLLTTAIALTLSSIDAHALPTGGTVAAGSATITYSAPYVSVNQTSSKAVINWTGFNTNRNETVQFNDPNSSAITLNRVSGSATSFDGALNSNGNVWVINPSGVLIGPDAQVNVNSFLATTSNIADSDFMAGKYNFTPGGGPASATVSNAGTITVASAGLAALVAPNVANSGAIGTFTANAGNITLASGDTFTVDLAGDGLINLAASKAMTQQSISTNGQSNLNASGGSITITAAQASGLLDNLINLGGGLEADHLTVSNQSGDLEYAGGWRPSFGGEGNGGDVKLSAYRNVTLDQGIEANGAAGKYNITIDANDTGAAGGGSIYIKDTYLGGHEVGLELNSNGGNIVLGGGQNPLTGYARGDNAPGKDEAGDSVYSNGITLEGTSLNANSNIFDYHSPGGNITLNGEGLSFANDASGKVSRGVYAYDPLGLGDLFDAPDIGTNTGNVTINGIGGTALHGTSYGVDLENAQAGSGDGAISVTGTAGSAGVTTGVNLYESGVGANTSNFDKTGSVFVEGTGGDAAGVSTGVSVVRSGISAYAGGTKGKLTLLGTGGDAISSTGILLEGGAGGASGGQGTTIEGLAGNSGFSGTGVQVSFGSGIAIFGAGGSLIGGGVAGARNYSGVKFYEADVGPLDVIGTGNGAGSTGIEMDHSTFFGSFTFTGTAQGVGSTGIQGNLSSNNLNCFFQIANCFLGTSKDHLTFITDSLNLHDTVIGNINPSAPGYADVTFLPLTSSTSIGVAGGKGSLQIPADLLYGIIDTSNVTIGSTSDTGAMTIGSNYWSNNWNTSNNTYIPGQVKFLNGSGDITLTGVTYTDKKDSITVATLSGDFINDVKGVTTPLAPGPGGRFLIYTASPANDILNGLGYDFSIYGCTYGFSCPHLPPTGNGLVFSEPPPI